MANSKDCLFVVVDDDDDNDGDVDPNQSGCGGSERKCQLRNSKKEESKRAAWNVWTIQQRHDSNRWNEHTHRERETQKESNTKMLHQEHT